MDLRDYAHTEASAFVERLIDAAEASTDQVRRSADKALDALASVADGLRQQAEGLRTEVDRLRSESGQRLEESQGLRAQLDLEAARAAALDAEIDALKEKRRQAEDERLAAAAAHAHTEAELRNARGELEDSRARLAGLSEALEAEVAGRAHLAGVSQGLEADVSRLSAALEAETAARARAQEAHDGIVGALRARHDQAIDDLQVRHDEIVSHLQAALEAAQRHRQGNSEQTGEIERRLHEADAMVTRLRTQVMEANAMTDAVHQGMAVMRARSQRIRTLLQDSVNALHALGPGATAADVFGTLVRLLAAEFPRVAIFRVKGNHLQGELSAGVDASIDITKLVIPVSLDSVVSRAAAGTTLEQATAEQIADSRPPFGGTPASALAAPLLFQGETLAVVYVDSDDAPNDAHAAFAGILVAHANVLLSRLTQELKTAKVLREYAQMLLREAEQMFLADVEEGRPEADRLGRLHDTIEFGRQLFDQRADLEGGIAAGLLDDEISALIRAEPITPFGSGLAAALADTRERRTAS
jgi:uncharacterized protein YoxC